MEDVGIFYEHLVYCTDTLHLFSPFGIIFHGYLAYFFPVLVCCIKESLATLTLRGKKV
jgi:hypothetical protein